MIGVRGNPHRNHGRGSGKAGSGRKHGKTGE